MLSGGSLLHLITAGLLSSATRTPGSQYVRSVTRPYVSPRGRPGDKLARKAAEGKLGKGKHA